MLFLLNLCQVFYNCIAIRNEDFSTHFHCYVTVVRVESTVTEFCVQPTYQVMVSSFSLEHQEFMQFILSLYFLHSLYISQLYHQSGIILYLILQHFYITVLISLSLVPLKQ